MNTQTISIDIPSEIFLALNETEDEIKRQLKIDLAVRLYMHQKLTIGKAAQLGGLSKSEFEALLSEYEIPISHLSLQDVLEDIKKVK